MPECQTTARVIHSEDAGVEVIDEQSPRHRGSHTMQSSKRTKQATSNRRAERATAIANVRKTTKAPSGRAKKQASAAAAYASQQVGSAATVVASKDSCRVVHREFIGNVTFLLFYLFSVLQAHRCHRRRRRLLLGRGLHTPRPGI